MNPYTEVLFEELPGKQGSLGIITLNRPQVLNSLNLSMIKAIHDQLQAWENAKHIKAVVIKSAPGRAFCAGGDLRVLYDHYLAHDAPLTEFFYHEYRLNRYIFHYPKPYIALLDGITMGGGVGVSIHGSHRIATDKLLFAMPETGIGFFPDIGGTYFLPRLPGYIGFYLGLTGVRIASDDCVALGIAQQKVSSELLPILINALAEKQFAEDADGAVTEVIAQFKISVSTSKFIEQQESINDCFSANTMEEIMYALKLSSNLLCKEASHVIAKKSPTSLKISLAAMQKGKKMDFDDSMAQEYNLTSHFLKGHDFFEGIRAVIIDKDQKPQWRPNTLELVTKEKVEDYFTIDEAGGLSYCVSQNSSS